MRKYLQLEGVGGDGIGRIHMLKKIVKEADNIVIDLHNIDAGWIVSGTIAWARLAANFPKTIATLLSDHNLAHHGLGTIVPHDALASLTERAHGSLTGVTANQHHPAPIDDSVNKEVVIPFDGGGGGGGGFPSSPPEGGIQIVNIYYDPVNEEQILET
ncbi:hypothetical protein ES708_17628 [subsurface metagenome]